MLFVPLLAAVLLAVSSAADGTGLRINGAGIQKAVANNNTYNLPPLYTLYLASQQIPNGTTSAGFSYASQCSDSDLLSFVATCVPSVSITETGSFVIMSDDCWKAQCEVISPFLRCVRAVLKDSEITTNLAYHAGALKLMSDCTSRGYDAAGVTVGNLASVAAALLHPASATVVVAAIAATFATLL